MSELQQSDLILAGSFVDGELSSDRRIDVENRIQTDPVFAAAVEQLRAQRSLLRRLPKFEPNEELADQTLRASMDQVQAIVGMWPVESQSNSPEVVSLASDRQESFNWKSFVVVAATLAGVLFLGVMMWPGDGGAPSSSGVAMNGNQTPDLPEGESISAASDFIAAESSIDDLTENSLAMRSATPALADAAPSNSGGSFLAPSDVESESAKPAESAESEMRLTEIVSFSGTPVKTVPVEQVWYVKQSTPVPDVESVNRILASNSIDVRANVNSLAGPKRQSLESRSRAGVGSTSVSDDTNAASDVEAFYVAATPSQMKKALAEISNQSDISMFEVPQGTAPVAAAKQAPSKPSNSPAGSEEGVAELKVAAAEANLESNLIDSADPASPRRIELSPNGAALAQQLVNQSLPKSAPRGPVPPILESGMEVAGLKAIQSDDADAAMGGMGMGFGPESADAGMSRSQASIEGEATLPNAGTTGPKQAASRVPQPIPMQSEGSAKPKPVAARSDSSRYFDRHFDDSDKQLRQYLILIRGSEKQESETESDASQR